MKSNNLNRHFNCCCSEKIIMQNHQEIEQAVDEVTGKNIDKRIQQIWERFIK